MPVDDGLAHVHAHADDPAGGENEPGVHNAAERVNRELSFLRVAVVVQEFGKNAQTVAGFFRFAAIRIQDAHSEIRAGIFGDNEDAIAADAGIAMANNPGAFGRQLKRRVHDEVIVTESVGTDKITIQAHLFNSRWYS